MKKARIITLKRKIKKYLKKKQLLKSKEYTKLEKPFLKKARKNFTVAKILLKVSDEDKLKEILNVPVDFEMYDWTVIVFYYSMYVSSLAALARLGYKSKSHAATLAVLEYNYVHQQRGLEIEHLNKLSKAYAVSKALITKLIQTKTKREIAQYEATPAIFEENALSALDDADKFITKIEEVLSRADIRVIKGK